MAESGTRPWLPIRLLDGAQNSWFNTAGLFDEKLAVTPLSNRMGIRLSGRPILLRRGGQMPEPDEKGKRFLKIPVNEL